MKLVIPLNLKRCLLYSPLKPSWFGYSWKDKGRALNEGFYYSSDNNSEWLDVEGIKKFIAPFEELYAQGKLEG